MSLYWITITWSSTAATAAVGVTHNITKVNDCNNFDLSYHLRWQLSGSNISVCVCVGCDCCEREREWVYVWLPLWIFVFICAWLREREREREREVITCRHLSMRQVTWTNRVVKNSLVAATFCFCSCSSVFSAKNNSWHLTTKIRSNCSMATSTAISLFAASSRPNCNRFDDF